MNLCKVKQAYLQLLSRRVQHVHVGPSKNVQKKSLEKWGLWRETK